MNKKAPIRLTLLVVVACVSGGVGGCDGGADRGGTGGQGSGASGTGGTGGTGGTSGTGGTGGTGGTSGTGGTGGLPAGFCHLVGCGPVWELRRALPAALTVSEIQQLRVEVCRNDWCFGTSFADFRPSEPFMKGGGLGKMLPRTGDGDPIIQVIFWGTDAGKAGEVDVTWSFGSRPSAAGDVFSVDLLRMDGASTLRVEEAVDYETFTPNGPDCPPVCEHAVPRGG